MPPFEHKLNEEDVEGILAHIKTWWTVEQREGQADRSLLYQEALEKQGESER